MVCGNVLSHQRCLLRAWDSLSGSGQQQRRQREVFGEIVTLRIGHFRKIRRQHAAQRRGDLRDPLNQFSGPELCPLKRPNQKQQEETEEDKESRPALWRRRGFKKDIINYFRLLSRAKVHPQ